jgi:hypothetical protein
MQSDCRLFLRLNTLLVGQSVRSDQVTKDAMQEWLERLAANFRDEGTYKLVRRHDACLSSHGDSVEAWLNAGTNKLQ